MARLDFDQTERLTLLFRLQVHREMGQQTNQPLLKYLENLRQPTHQLLSYFPYCPPFYFCCNQKMQPHEHQKLNSKDLFQNPLCSQTAYLMIYLSSFLTELRIL